MTADSALFEAVVAGGQRRLTTSRASSTTVATDSYGTEGEITRWSVDSAFLTSTDGFEFEFIGATLDDKRGLELAPVEILIDGSSQLYGRIDITRRGDKGPSVVTCLGRDYIADLVEGNCDPAIVVASGATLESAILTACGPYGITAVEGPEARQAARTKKKQKPTKRPRKRQLVDGKPEPGQGVYDYCNRILARHGVTMQPGSDPTKVVLQSPNYDQTAIGRIIRKDDPKTGPGNVISGVAVRDFSRMPTYALMSGRQGPPTQTTTRILSSVTLGGNWVQEYGTTTPVARSNWVARDAVISTQKITKASLKNSWDLASIASAVSSDLWSTLATWALAGYRTPKSSGAITGRQLYRLLYFRDDNAKNQEQIDASALRAVAERMKDTLCYEVTLRGLMDPDTGYFWAVDTIVEVDDDIADVHEPLWIASRKFSFDGKELRTVLQCWRPGSFVIGDTNA